MNRLEWLAALSLSLLTFGSTPAFADNSGTTWPEEEEEEEEEEAAEEQDGDESDDGDDEAEEDEKGCSHVLQPHNLVVAGAGFLVFTLVARRDP